MFTNEEWTRANYEMKGKLNPKVKEGGGGSWGRKEYYKSMSDDELVQKFGEKKKSVTNLQQNGAVWGGEGAAQAASNVLYETFLDHIILDKTFLVEIVLDKTILEKTILD